jgi:ABC-2 type transport system ATP-binding protein
VRDWPADDSGRMTNLAVMASGLRKAYKDKIVLDGIDLRVDAGTVFSLLGPNGAGKTTTVNVLTTLLKPDGGTVRVAGHDVATEAKAVRAAIGVTGQFAAVDELLTGQETFALHGPQPARHGSEAGFAQVGRSSLRAKDSGPAAAARE